MRHYWIGLYGAFWAVCGFVVGVCVERFRRREPPA
jgi:hypothetical protein